MAGLVFVHTFTFVQPHALARAIDTIWVIDCCPRLVCQHSQILIPHLSLEYAQNKKISPTTNNCHVRFIWLKWLHTSIDRLTNCDDQIRPLFPPPKQNSLVTSLFLSFCLCQLFSLPTRLSSNFPSIIKVFTRSWVYFCPSAFIPFTSGHLFDSILISSTQVHQRTTKQM